MAMAVATRTQTYLMLVSKMGPGEARNVVQREVNALVPRFQDTWNHNLATAYAKQFSSEELQSLAADGRNSKYAPKLAERQSLVGTDMRAASESVLTELVTEAMKNAFTRSVP